ncbi:MAG: DUF1499 domain-containing protein [Methyloceanibacter sp.]
MTAIYLQKTVHEGLWSRRMALFFLQLLVLTVILHRFGTLATPAAINLFAVSVIGLFLAIAVAILGLVRIWFGGQSGAKEAFAGIAIAAVGLAAPLWFSSQFFLLPRLNDIETTPRQPMQFRQLARPADANRIEDPDLTKAEEQEAAYPDIRSMELERSSIEVYDMVHEAVKRMGWTIVLNEPPGDDGIGRIEATDTTMILGFTDDVLVRVRGDDTQAFIDLRSASRYGMHDLGANAKRIRGFFDEIKATLEKGEKTGLEQAEPKAPKAAVQRKLKKPKKKQRVRRNRRSTAPQDSPPQRSFRPGRQRPLNPF